MPAQNTEWTAELVRTLPDDGHRYEVLDGELLVTPAPSYHHQIILARLYDVIAPYVRRHSLGWTLWSPADIEFAPKTLLQPDLFVVPDAGKGEPRDWSDIRTLLLAVETLSPSTARNDRLKKRPKYQELRVPQYWIVDPDSRLIERWRPDDDRPEVMAETLEWNPRAEIEPLRIALEQVFGPLEVNQR